MSSFIDLAKTRYACRKYKDLKVEEDKLELILEAGRIAPSAYNYQPLYFIVIDDEAMLDKLTGFCGNSGGWLKKVPVMLAVCSEYGKSWIKADGRASYEIDAAIAIDHMTLQAAELGLGTCWVCGFYQNECRELLGIPSQVEIVAFIPVGYPQEDRNGPKVKNRKSKEQIVSKNTFGAS